MRTLSFPCEKRRYCKIVGELLPRTLANILRSFGFEVADNPLSENDVDLKVHRDKKLILVVEVLNWSISSRLPNKRKCKIIENLCAFDNVTRRALIHSVPNSNINEEFAEKDIDTVCIGFQLLPQEFYSFFVEKGHVVKRKPFTAKAFFKIKATIANYLEEKGLIVEGNSGF